MLLIADKIVAAEKGQSYTTSKPVLLLVAAKDVVGMPAMQLEPTQAYAPNLTVEELAAGHWLQLEAKDEVNQALRNLFDKR